MKKILAMLSLLLTLCILCGCTKDAKDEESTTASSEEAVKSFDIISDGKSDFEIVYPDNSNGAEANAVLEFSKLFSERFGIDLNKKTDFIKPDENRKDSKHKILIGKTNYDESQKVYSELRYKDYKVIADNENLVIAAYTSEGFKKALSLIEENVFANSDSGKLSVLNDLLLEGSYAKGYKISSWTICSNELNNYSIIYSNRKDEESVIKLRKQIAEVTGYYLDVYEDSRKEPGKFEILFGDTNREESSLVNKPSAMSYIFKVVNNKLVIKTGGRESEISIYNDFLNIVGDGVKKIRMSDSYVLEGNYFDDPVSKSKPDDADLRLVSLNAMANVNGYDGEAREVGYEFARRVEIFYGFLDFYKPDVIGLQEFCPDWYKAFDEYEHADKWDIIKIKNPHRGLSNEYVFTTVAYRKDLFTLIDSGSQFYSKHNNNRCRCYTWVVLKDNKTGKEFCFVSNHWDQEKDADQNLSPNSPVQVEEFCNFVNDMAKKYPVYTTGDFNNNEWSNAIKNFLANTSSVDSMYAAEKRLNKIASWHYWGTQNHSSGSCDHITATSKDSQVLQFETVCYNRQVFASDHAWLLADIKIK